MSHLPPFPVNSDNAHSSENRALTIIRHSFLFTFSLFSPFQSENIQIFPITVASTFVTLSWNTSSALSTGRKGYVLQVRKHRRGGGGGGGGPRKRNRSRASKEDGEVRLGGRGSNADPEIIKQ